MRPQHFELGDHLGGAVILRRRHYLYSTPTFFPFHVWLPGRVQPFPNNVLSFFVASLFFSITILPYSSQSINENNNKENKGHQTKIKRNQSFVRILFLYVYAKLIEDALAYHLFWPIPKRGTFRNGRVLDRL